jgi:hypothetical protein
MGTVPPWAVPFFHNNMKPQMDTDEHGLMRRGAIATAD